jgi:hypothetical protein
LGAKEKMLEKCVGKKSYLFIQKYFGKNKATKRQLAYKRIILEHKILKFASTTW